jgi:PAS domain S-box-containing protein
LQDDIRVLHVDDDRDLTDLLSAWFEANVDGMSVIAENDPADALEVTEAANVDCVVSDFDMPGTDGLEFLEQIHSLYPDLPFILYTGKGSEEIASEAISAGVTDYLQKETGTEQYEVLANRIENAVERRRARQALEESEQKYSTLVEEANDGVLIVQDGIIEFVNQKTADILGTTVEEIEGEFMPSYVAPEDRDLLADRYARREAGEDIPNRYQFTALSPEGEHIPIELTSSQITYEGDPAVMAICRDISDRVEREAKLEQYRTLVETVGDAMYALDETGTITMVNEALTERMGLSSDELVGENFTAFLREEDVETGLEVIRDLLASDDRSRGRFEFEMTIDGETRVYEDSLAVITDEDGTLQGSVGTIRDVTERKERERMLRRQNERLEEVVSVLSHDLRNPLEVAQGRTSLLRETVTDGEGDETAVGTREAEHLDRIDRAHARMGAIIDDVLTLARQGATATAIEPTDVGAVAEEAWLHVDTAGATLRTENCPTIEADPGRLTQLLENLFRNAVEHGSTSPRQAGDTVEHGSTANQNAQRSGDAIEHGATNSRPGTDDGLEHAGESVTVRVGGDGASFYVADDGPGIPPDERDRVFESGFTTAEEGTGFGLAIVREIAEAHDWSVDVTENEEGGARFEFTGIRTV